MERINWTKYGLIALVALVGWSILGGLILNSKFETIAANTGIIWTAVEGANEKLPRLEQQVMVGMADRKDIIKQITDARVGLAEAQASGNLDKANAAFLQAQSAIAGLKIVVEAYPDVSLVPLQVGLFDETSGEINRIRTSRQNLIDSQASYNRTRPWFPINAMLTSRMPILGETANPAQRLNESQFGNPTPQK